jgi:hypothetical protein
MGKQASRLLVVLVLGKHNAVEKLTRFLPVLGDTRLGQTGEDEGEDRTRKEDIHDGEMAWKLMTVHGEEGRGREKQRRVSHWTGDW